VGGECRDIGEGRIEALLARPELQFAQARRVDQRTAAGQRNQLAKRRGVAATAVMAAYLARSLQRVAE
jgi:hypothetical protein